MVQKMVQSIILPYAVNQQVRKWGQVDGKCSQRSIRNLELFFLHQRVSDFISVDHFNLLVLSADSCDSSASTYSSPVFSNHHIAI